MSKSSRAKHNLNLSKLRSYYAIAERQNLPWYEYKQALENSMNKIGKFLAQSIISTLELSSISRALFGIFPIKSEEENSNV